MPKVIDIINKRFGRFIVVSRTNNSKWGKSRWLCKCDCGKEKIITGSELKCGNTKSCGCLHLELITQQSTRHGHGKKGEESQSYRAWLSMTQRCTNPNNSVYKYYGGRGIIICKKWKNSFNNFLEDMGEPPTNKHTLDRIDTNGNYCKSNCRWATWKQQQRNRRNNHLETYNGRTQCLAIWAEETGIAQHILWKRFSRGWSPKRALTTPVR